MSWIRRRCRVELAGFSLNAPWDLKKYILSKTKIGAVGKTAGPRAFLEWQRRASELDLFVYSDGSRNESGLTAGGYAIYRGSNLIASGSTPLGSSADVYDAEIIAAVTGAQVAVNTPEASLAENIHVCLDNEAAAVTLSEEYKESSNFEHITNFISLRKSWLLRPRGTYWPKNVGNINIRWCPGHSGIEGNEKADLLAKESCRSVLEIDLPDTIKRAKRKVEERFNKSRIIYFENNAPQRYRDLELEAKDKTPYTLRLPRDALGHLLAARSGHGDFSSYHTRFQHRDAEHNCLCGSPKSPTHFYFCPKARQLAPLNVPGHYGHQATKWLLNTNEGAKLFSKWIHKSRFYKTCGPRVRHT